jgi:two-component system chemotaxis response regulator CheY
MGIKIVDIKMLVAEDDFFSRRFMMEVLAPYGQVDVAVNGEETILAFSTALNDNDPYDLICLDIVMPVMDGQETLKRIRRIEDERGIHGLDGVKVIMVTGVDDKSNIMSAFKGGCEGYVQKPVDEDKLLELLRDLELISG